MRIHDTKLPDGIENQSVLLQERVFNVCRIAIMVQNRMKRVRKFMNYIYLLYIFNHVRFKRYSMFSIENI